MMRDGFGLRFHDLGETLLQGFPDHRMQPCAPASQKSRVGRIPHERMFERVDRPWYLAPAKYQLRLNQLRKGLLKSLSRQSGDNAQQFIRKLATHYGTD